MNRIGGGGTPGPAGPAGAAGAPGTPGQTVGNALIGGGGIVATGNLGLTVAAATYQIGSVSYTSAQTDLTLDAADGSNPRIDIIALNTSGVAVVVAGTASANPFEPVLDPATQLRLSAITVDTGATAISYTNTIIFTEGGVESWTETASGAPISVANATTPITGSVDCKATSGVNGNYMQFANGSDFDTTTRNLLALTIKNTSALPSQKSLIAQWYDGTVARGSPVPIRNNTFGFSGSDTTTEQVVPIPMQSFAVAGLPVDTLRLTITGGGSAWSFQVDDIYMQAGIAQTPANDSMRYRGTYSAAVQYVLNDVVTYLGTLYIATQQNLAVTPTSSGWTSLVTSQSRPNIFSGRLTLESGVPVSSRDQTAKTTIYFTPHNGNQISLYNGASWDTVAFTETSIAIGTLTDATLYDLFAYNNAGVLAFDSPVVWRNSGAAISAITTATPMVVTSNSHGIQNGDIVHITGVNGINANGTWTVANRAANTFELSGSAGSGTYVNGGYIYARVTSLALQDGVYVKSGTATRLYVGTFLTTSTTTTESSESKRNLYNQFNQVPLRLLRYDSTSHVYNSATSRFWNNSSSNRVSFVHGGALPIAVSSHLYGSMAASSTEMYTLQAIDGGGAGYVGNDFFVSAPTNGISNGVSAEYHVMPGAHFVAVYEVSSASGTNTFRSFSLAVKHLC